MIKIIGNTVQIGHEVIQPVFENGNYVKLDKAGMPILKPTFVPDYMKTISIREDTLEPDGNYNYSNGLTIDELEQVVVLLKKHFVTKDDMIGNEPVTRQLRLNPEERNENI